MADDTTEGQLPVIGEHEAPRAEPDDPNEKERQDDIQTVKWVESLFTEAKKSRNRVDSDWLEHWKFYKGKQWKERRPSYRHSEVLNFISSEVQTVFSLLLDTKPNIETLPEDPSDFEFSEILTQVLRSNWERRHMAHALGESAIDSIVLGTGIGHVPWDKELDEGIGDYKLESQDPFYFYVDPNCRGNINDKEHCQYVFTAVPTHVSRVKSKYPEKAKEIKSDIGSLTQTGASRDELDEVRTTSPIDKGMVFQESDVPDDEQPNRVLVLTLYIRPDDVEEIAEDSTQNAEGNERAKIATRKKYPKGRKIVIANRHILEDTELEDKDQLFPFATFPSQLNPRTIWGTGDVDILKNPQVIINKLVSYVLDVLILMGNPIWIVDDEAGVDDDELINQPGLIVTKNKGGEVRREAGTGLQPYVLNTLDMFVNNIWEKLRTSSEVSQGVAPSSGSSGFAIEQLQQAAQTRIRSKARNLDFFMSQIGALQINHILDKYAVPKVVRITNNQNASNYFKVAVSEEPVLEEQEVEVQQGLDEFGGPVMGTEIQQVDTGQTQLTASAQEIGVDPETKQPIMGDVKSFPIKGRFDLRINTGTQLPISKANKANTARQLFLDGIYDPEDYLNDIEVPNKEKVLEKLNQRQAQQAELAAQQQAAGLPPGGPPGGGKPPI